MPDADRLLHTLRRAVQLFRDMTERKGRVVSLVGATEVLASGDLHGSVENFRLILTKAELGRHPQRHLVLQEVVHGPFEYPAGGDKSHQLLDLVAALKYQYPRQVHFLPGNHELSQGTDRRISKGDRDLNAWFEEGVHTAYGDRAGEVSACYRQLFAAAPLAVRTANRVFLSHSLPPGSRLAGFDPTRLERDEPAEEDLKKGGAVYDLVWGRDTRPETVAAFLHKVDADLLITGHIPCDRGFDAPNDRQLILDSMDTPAACCLFPADRPLTHAELIQCVSIL
jgi:hypothetical protein